MKFSRQVFYKIISFVFLTHLLHSYDVFAQSSRMLMQEYKYSPNKKNLHQLGMSVDLGFNTGSGLIHTEEGWATSARTVSSIAPEIAFFAQYGLSEKLSFRISMGIGTSEFSFLYAQSFDSIGADQMPRLSEKAGSKHLESHGTSAMYLMPRVSLGYLFGPINRNYFLELRLGIAGQVYLGKSSKDDITTFTSKIEPDMHIKGEITADYGNYKTWGSILGDVYIGVRWKEMYGEFLNRSGFGIQITLPVSYDEAGYTSLKYYNTDWNSLIGHEKIYLSLMKVGVRYTYRFVY